MATIYVKDLIVEGRHGVHRHEKDKAQSFSISVEMTVDITKAVASDKLEDTINWSLVRDKIIATVQNNSFDLNEKLAQTIAEELLEEKRIQKINVAVDKLEAFDSGIPGVKVELVNTTDKV